MTTSGSTILFDGNDIVLHHRPGEAKYLVVSFMGAYREKEATTTYLLKEFAETYEIPCLGITSKVRGFYLTPEIDQVLDIASDILRRYETIILVGYSMGGYACIKYASRFGATHVLSLAPFYSLDPVDIPDGPLAELHRANLAQAIPSFRFTMLPAFIGMAAKPTDYAPNTFILYDPSTAFDNYDAHRYARSSPHVTLVPMFHCGHSVFARLSKPDVMSQMIHAVRSGEETIVRRQVHIFSRTQVDAILDLLNKAVKKHPVLSLRAILTDRVRSNRNVARLYGDIVNTRIIYGVVSHGLFADAYEHLDRYLTHLLSRKISAIPPGTQPDGVPRERTSYLLLSARGNFLAYEIEPHALRLHHSAFTDNTVLPVFARISGTAISLHVVKDGRDTALPLLPDAEWVLDANRIVVRTPTGFLRAEDEDRLTFDSTGIGTMERFALLPILPASVERRADAGTWFDQIVATDPTPTATPAAKTRPFWTRLFGRVSSNGS